MKFRQHRGSLEDSLKTTVSFDTFTAFKDYLVELLGLEDTRQLHTLDVEFYGYDERCDQYLHIVKYQDKPIGFIFEV